MLGAARSLAGICGLVLLTAGTAGCAHENLRFVLLPVHFPPQPPQPPRAPELVWYGPPAGPEVFDLRYDARLRVVGVNCQSVCQSDDAALAAMIEARLGKDRSLQAAGAALRVALARLPVGDSQPTIFTVRVKDLPAAMSVKAIHEPTSGYQCASWTRTGGVEYCAGEQLVTTRGEYEVTQSGPQLQFVEMIRAGGRAYEAIRRELPRPVGIVIRSQDGILEPVGGAFFRAGEPSSERALIAVREKRWAAAAQEFEHLAELIRKEPSSRARVEEAAAWRNAATSYVMAERSKDADRCFETFAKVRNAFWDSKLSQADPDVIIAMKSIPL